MIEDVLKSTKRKETIDEKYMSELFDEMKSLYRLDQIVPEGEDYKRKLSAMPVESVILLVGIGTVMLGLATFTVIEGVKKKGK